MPIPELKYTQPTVPYCILVLAAFVNLKLFPKRKTRQLQGAASHWPSFTVSIFTLPSVCLLHSPPLPLSFSVLLQRHCSGGAPFIERPLQSSQQMSPYISQPNASSRGSLLTTKVSVCSPGSGCHGTHYVDQAGLLLTETHLFLPPECWD
jgi:hypothetical protein